VFRIARGVYGPIWRWLRTAKGGPVVFKVVGKKLERLDERDSVSRKARTPNGHVVASHLGANPQKKPVRKISKKRPNKY